MRKRNVGAKRFGEGKKEREVGSTCNRLIVVIVICLMSLLALAVREDADFVALRNPRVGKLFKKCFKRVFMR